MEFGIRWFQKLLRPQLWICFIVLAVLGAGVMDVRAQERSDVDTTNKAFAQIIAHASVVESARATAATVQPTGTDCTQVACLALTFDDGPNPITTPQVLNVLEREQVPATFFLIGSRVKGNEALIQRMYQNGNEIGNHSWSHPNMTKLSLPEIHRQIELTQAAIVSTGIPTPTLFRPPYGLANLMMHANIPLTFMFWNEDPRDWAVDSPQKLQAALLGAARPGGVVDMHDIYQVTANTLAPTIDELKKRQFHFVTVSQLLDIKPGQQGDFYGHP